MRRLFALFALLVVVSPFACAAGQPNILWLTAEDHGPHLGCYGDPDAVTPHLDAFAARALRYTRASSNAPICAPARTTLVTGLHAPSLGAHHMRSEVPVPEWLTLYPRLLRKHGYYCTNNSKTDYNLAGPDGKAWDASSGKAHYRNRPDGAPFFAVFNKTITHESQIRNANPKPIHHPSRVSIPPYHPDIPEVRKDWAQYHDRITQMDQWFGQQLKALEEAGLAEDTIVFFYADHGSGMPRSKRYAGWSGLHVPLLVHIPEKFKHLRPADYRAGGSSDRLVGFVDLAPTLLSLIGAEPEPYHQGHAFLGTRVAPAPAYSFGFVGRADERPDENRSVTDGRYIYIRNFMPHTPLLKGLDYQMQTPTTRRWKELHEAGKLDPVQAFAWTAPRPAEELYDLQADPHETRNLAEEKPELAGNFREALRQHLVATRDLGLLPESTMHALARRHGMTPADFARSEHFPAEALAAVVLAPPGEAAGTLVPDRPAVLATQLRSLVVAAPTLLKDGTALRDTLLSLLDHEAAEVRAGAAEILLADPGSRARAIETLVALADPAGSDPFAALHALDALSRLDRLDPPTIDTLRQTNQKPSGEWPGRVQGYVQRLNPAVVRQFSSN